MIRKYFLILFLFFVAVLLLTSSMGNAGEQKNKTTLKENFLEVAFSTHIWWPDYRVPNENLKIFKFKFLADPVIGMRWFRAFINHHMSDWERERYKDFRERKNKVLADPKKTIGRYLTLAPGVNPDGSQHIWWKPFVMLDGGDPALDVVNKWTVKKVPISCGFPEYGAGTDYNVDGVIKRSIDREFCKKLSEFIFEFSPIIKETTGVEISYQQPDSKEENSLEYARIRVISHLGAFNNFFKFPLYTGSSPFRHYLSTDYVEAAFLSAVAFTPDTRTQVDGYFIPDSGNNISMAVCKINPTVGENLIRHLMAECILRSMGIPELLDDHE